MYMCVHYIKACIYIYVYIYIDKYMKIIYDPKKYSIVGWCFLEAVGHHFWGPGTHSYTSVKGLVAPVKWYVAKVS